jgi:cellulose synthase/poly-beta-1,6-N-acetylglucosamine synthase-like glycosyltransferase
MLNDQKFIEKLVSPILYSKGDLVSSNLDILSSKKFIENVFAIGYKAKNYLFESLNNGKNLYTCHGAARAFSKRLYKTFRFKDSIGEDAYSYLYCIYNGYKYAYVNNATAYIRYASNIGDHNKQSIRFMESQNKFLKEFGTEFIQKNYHIPKKLIAITGIQFVIKYPVYMIAYVAIQAYTRMLHLGAHKTQDTWEISKSSKNLRIYE